MKTLEQIKNEYAKNIGYGDWENLDYNVNDSKEFDEHWKNVCVIAQKECLKLAYENDEFYQDSDLAVLDYDSITNENNIIK